MGITYECLDDIVRKFMVVEVEHDISIGKLYISPRLTKAGADAWPKILLDSCLKYDDNWIVSTLHTNGFLQMMETYSTNGIVRTRKVPSNAADMLAEGEFNRFYIRGLCSQVISTGGSQVTVCRGKQVTNPRPESQALIGKKLPADRLLQDLRDKIGVEPVLGLPPGPNSGLTVKRD